MPRPRKADPVRHFMSLALTQAEITQLAALVEQALRSTGNGRWTRSSYMRALLLQHLEAGAQLPPLPPVAV